MTRTAKLGGPQAEACAAGATKRRPYEHVAGEDERVRLAAHRARCSICKHPEREEIESEFLDWVSPREIAEDWKLRSYRAIYRHAHAVGLFEKRRKNWLAALDSIIERVREVPVTANAVVAAIRLSLELEGERNGADRRWPGQKFLLSLDGLPRTNAVTGDAPGGGGTLQRAPTKGDAGGGEGLRREAVVRAGVAERATHASPLPAEDGNWLKPVPAERRDVGPRNCGGAGSGLAEGPAEVAAQGERTATVEPDPRIALGEDGRVAGIPWPWPKGKMAFARVGRRWRGP